MDRRPTIPVRLHCVRPRIQENLHALAPAQDHGQTQGGAPACVLLLQIV